MAVSTRGQPISVSSCVKPPFTARFANRRVTSWGLVGKMRICGIEHHQGNCFYGGKHFPAQAAQAVASKQPGWGPPLVAAGLTSMRLNTAYVQVQGMVYDTPPVYCWISTRATLPHMVVMPTSSTLYRCPAPLAPNST